MSDEALIHEIPLGRLTARIWADDTPAGPMFSVTVVPCEAEQAVGGWQGVRPDEVPLFLHLFEAAYTWIAQQIGFGPFVTERVRRFEFGAIAAEVNEVVSTYGITYEVTVHRRCDQTGHALRLFTARPDELHDVLSALQAATTVVHYLLDGGSRQR